MNKGENIFPPHLAEIFDALRLGRHISRKDGNLFYVLEKHESDFRDLFENLGFVLQRHQRDFFYFRDSQNFTELSARMAVFVFILIEWLADRGEPIEETIMTALFELDKLPHFQTERYRKYMVEAGVDGEEELLNVLRAMERTGFITRTDAESFEFETPAYRLLDLCMEVAEKESANKTIPSSKEGGKP